MTAPTTSTRPTARLFWGTAAAVIAADLVSKLLAQAHLAHYVPRRILGNVLRFTLAYNPGAAFSMSLGQHSRYIFGAFAVVALIVLWRLYRMTGAGARAGDRLRVVALGLAFGGAAGNLIDRFRSPRGVVDFIDIGVGDVRFWTFNLADSAVTVGALVLAWSLSSEERESAAAKVSVDRGAARAVDAPSGVPGPRE
ncbi:MAG TPA: signal peptidase II [Gemmatimonadaceae bacterium]|nr:signal peptidase II [Gemmatimonadaceae bacterium]